MKNKINVLITGVGSTTAISVIKGLKKQMEYKIKIVGTDIFQENNIAGSKFCDKFFVVPPSTNEVEYISNLSKIVDNEFIDILIPIVDVELEIIAKYRKTFNNTFVLLSSYDTIITCNDKMKTYEFFNKFEIPTLRTFNLENLHFLKKKISDSGIKYPFIVKPRKGVSSREVYEIGNIEENILIRRINNPIIQEKGNGTEYTIDIFGDGKQIISAVPRKRIETRAGISYKGETVKNNILIEYAHEIYKNLKFIGPANFQCFLNDEEVKFFDINPRFSGSLPLTIEAGINTPLMGIQLALNMPLKPINDFKEIKMSRYWEEIFYD
jgi:carbamoyl-phosphate synthase large subunit